MKVLFNHHLPFSFAHGGTQIQIEQTKAALEQIGVEVEMLRWWDDAQKGDVLHHFGRIPLNLVRAAKAKGLRVVFSDIMGVTSSRPRRRLFAQKIGQVALRRLLPRATIESLRWDSYKEADACIALTEWEAFLMRDIFQAPAERVYVVPNGVEQVFFAGAQKQVQRGPWLVSTATIIDRKRVLELAEAGVLSKTPVWIIGQPYAAGDPYVRRFEEFAARHPDFVRFQGPINDRAELAKIYGQARGFVLLSIVESLSLSTLEAAACGCPLLLTEQPWATWTFQQSATYCPPSANSQQIAPLLKRFYEAAPHLPAPPKPWSWIEVARRLRDVYTSL